MSSNWQALTVKTRASVEAEVGREHHPPQRKAETHGVEIAS